MILFLVLNTVTGNNITMVDTSRRNSQKRSNLVKKLSSGEISQRKKGSINTSAALQKESEDSDSDESESESESGSGSESETDGDGDSSENVNLLDNEIIKNEMLRYGKKVYAKLL